MLTLTAVGRVYDKVESDRDKKGAEFLRFKILCEEQENNGDKRIIIFRCSTYRLLFSSLKVGDMVCVSGKFMVRTGSGNGDYNLDIYVQNIIKCN